MNTPSSNQGQFSAIPGSVLEGIDPFIRRTYSVLMVSLAVIVGLGFVSYNFLPLTSLRPLAIADGVIWVACGWFGWRRPAYVTLGLFSVITGLFLGQSAHIYYPNVFATAAALTIAGFVGLSAYVHISKQSFSYLRSALFISFFVLVGGGIALAFFPLPIMDLGFSILGTLVFCGWILYDTSNLLERRDAFFTPEIAAFELLLDLIGLFRYVLRLLNSRS